MYRCSCKAPLPSPTSPGVSAAVVWAVGGGIGVFVAGVATGLLVVLGVAKMVKNRQNRREDAQLHPGWLS